MTDGFQSAAAEQMDALERVYRAAAAHTNERGVFQWRATFPTRDYIIRDMAERDLFVLVRGGEFTGATAADAEWKGALPLGCCTASA